MDFTARIPRDVETQKVRVFVQMFPSCCLQMHMFDLGGREEVLQVLSRHNIMPEQILVLDEKMSSAARSDTELFDHSIFGRPYHLSSPSH